MTDRKFLERYMLHLKNDNYMPKDVREVHYRATKLASNIDAKIGIVRIARKFIELDIFVKEENLDELIEKLAPIAPLDNVRHIIEEEVDKEKGIEDGIFYFNNERFWESHEAFEGVWKKCSGQEKETVQGIILLAVAFGHAQRDELSVGIGMLKRVLKKIETSSSEYHSIDIDRIRNNTIEMQKANKLTLFEI